MLKNLKGFNLPEIEKKVLHFWQSDDTFKKSLDKSKVGKPFVFFEGPPTANGRPGIHHVLTRAFKDIMLRYKTMRGYHVQRKAGWDTHGLPVEIEVEKELGINSKPEIEKYGIEKFNKKAKESVWKYKTEWEQLTERVGFWIDFDDPYVTYETNYIESLWWVIKQIHDRGYLYKGHRVAPWCSRCGTALSSHEIAQGYKTVTDTSVYVKFKLKSGQKIGDFEVGDNAYILSWTTTPWTLPGNVALAVGEDIGYQIVETRKGGSIEKLIFATDNILGKQALVFDDYEGNEIDFYKNTVTGSDLVGLKYEPLFDIAPLQSDTSHKVYAADFVTTGDGTGVVHTAVMYGEDDYQLGLELDLPQHHTVTEQGVFTKDVQGFENLSVKNKDTELKILEYLKSNNLLLSDEQYEHDYPHCWRCSTPLLYYARASWFIAMSKLKDKLLAANEQINWQPEHIKHGRFGNWLEDVKDWNFSRERYWGTPLPVWACEKCDHYEVIGSIEDLKKRSNEDVPSDPDLHRPFIDAYTFDCPKCKGLPAGRQGVMHRVKELIDVWFDSGAMPFAQWHYPFENKDVVDSGAQFPADYIVEAVDQTRGWFYTLLAISVLLGHEEPYKNCLVLGHILDGKGLKMSKSKGNIVDPWEMTDAHGADAIRWHFFTASDPGEPTRFDENDLKKASRRMFALLYNSYVFLSTYQGEDRKAISILDRWIISRLRETTREVTKHLDEYNIFKAGRALEPLVDDLSRWYIRRSRKDSSLATLTHVLKGISTLLAPFTPFFADALYQSVHVGGKSVHLEDWLDVKEEELDQKLLDDMSEVRRIASLALAKRDEAGIRVRQPLSELKVKADILKDNNDLLDILKDEVNVKNVVFGAKLKDDVELDTELTAELKAEGMVRELVRLIQGMRRDAKLNPKDEIMLVVFSADAGIKNVLQSHETDIRKTVNAKEIVFREGTTTVSTEKKIDGQTLKIGLRKI